jgi:mono/diheme cytochrome c family protein
MCVQRPVAGLFFSAQMPVALTALTLGVVGVAACALAATSAFDAAGNYQQRCAECHGARRYGGYAPPLVPTTLARKNDDALVQGILKGLPNTQMPAFEGQLDKDQARALVAFFRQAPDEFSWSLEDIRASRREDPITSAKIPREIRRENLILVVERGSGSVVVLEGETMTELDRFGVGRIHGGIKFDRALHQALAVTRDGTLVDYDLDRGAPRTRIKVGITGTLDQILFGPATVDDGSQNLVGAITTCMGNVGARSLREFQETEIIIAPSIKTEGKLFQTVQSVGMGTR